MGGRKHLRKAKGRPGFITAKEPGLQQPTKCQIWNRKRSQGQGRLRKGGKGLQGQQSNKSQGRGGNGTKQRKTEKERRGRSVRLNGRNTEMNIRHRPCYPLLRGAGRRGAGSSCPSSQGQRKAEEPEESKTQKYQTT